MWSGLTVRARHTVRLGLHDRALELFLSKQSRVVHYNVYLRGPLATSISTAFIGLFNRIVPVGEEMRTAVMCRVT